MVHIFIYTYINQTKQAKSFLSLTKKKKRSKQKERTSIFFLTSIIKLRHIFIVSIKNAYKNEIKRNI